MKLSFFSSILDHKRGFPFSQIFTQHRSSIVDPSKSRRSEFHACFLT
jgi:hypothetical protein